MDETFISYMDKLFVLYYAWYEDYVPHILTGPENISQKQFESICDDLVPEAAELAMKNAYRKDFSESVGWIDIVDAMLVLLKLKGFNKITPKTHGYSGGIIDERDLEYYTNKQNNDPEGKKQLDLLKDKLSKVVEYNKKVDEEMNKDMDKQIETERYLDEEG
jgi:hypothetical protein